MATDQTAKSVDSIAALAEYFTLDEVAARYRAPKETVRHWRKINYGPRGVKVGTRILYSRAEIARFDKELTERSQAG
jgi:hypothetical protein